MTVGRMQIVHREPRKTRQDSSSLHVGLRCPATDFEQVCGAAQAALRISRVVSDVVRAYGVDIIRQYPQQKATRIKVQIQCGGIFCASEVREFCFLGVYYWT